MKIAVILLSLCLLTGCYDNKETDTLATVMAVGVDEAENEKEYTFAVADSGAYSGDAKGDSTSLICFTEKGKDIDSALDSLDRRLSKKLSFSHLSAVVFSKKSAKKDMYSDISYLEKKASVRPQAMIAITDLSAKKYLKGLRPSLEVNPERYFQYIMDKNEFYVSELSLSDFTNAYHTGETASAPVIKSKKNDDKLSEEDTYISSTALIKSGKLKDIVKDNWLIGLVHSQKKVTRNGHEIRSIQKPKVDIDTSSENPIVSITFHTKSDNGLKKDKLKKETLDFLNNYAQKGLDVMNAKAHAKKEFRLQKSYDKYNFDIKKAKFEAVYK